MKNLIHEIHRRSLWQVLGIYLAASWVAIQVVNEIGEAVGLPEWVSGGALVLLVIGFPIVLATAFIQRGVVAGPSIGPTPGEALETSASEASDTVAAAPAVAAPSIRRGHHRLFTWRNALLGGVGAFVLFGAGTAAWMALRALGIGPAGTLVAKGALEERALVILADFEAEDETLANAATEALRVDLSQSEIIRLAEPSLIADALGRMDRDPSESLTEDVASEVAVREGAGAVITGAINRAGAGHVFSAQVVSTDGSLLTSQRESAADETDVIPAIDRLSKKLRERIGESFKSIRAAPPLARVTTSNLEALRLYSQAFRDRDRELSLLEQAIALDSGFAMAWRGVGIFFRNRQIERARTVDAFTRAFEHRDRLAERERRLAAASYYTDVTFEPEKAVLEYEALLDRNPEDITALTNLGVAYSELRDFARSEELSLRKTALEPENFGTGYWNTAHDQLNQGKFREARATVDTALARAGPGPGRMYLASIIAGAEGELEEAEGILEELDRPETPPGFVYRLAGDLAAVTSAQGRVAEASDHLRRAMSAAEETEQFAEFLEVAIQAAWLDVVVRERPADGLALLEEGLTRHPLADLAPLDRPYTHLAEVFARAGEPGRAAQLITELEAEVPPELRRGMQAEVERARGETALAEGRYTDAIASFRRSDKGNCVICALPGQALAYERAGDRDSAIALHERFATTPYSDRFQSYMYDLGPALGPTYERLGELYDEQGDLENASRYYALFVELWAEADEELQPRVRAAQARLEEILRERG